MCSSPLKGHFRCCNVNITKQSFNRIPFEFAANLFCNGLHTLTETSVERSTGQKTRRGRLGQSFHWICRSDLLKEVFFHPFLLSSVISLPLFWAMSRIAFCTTPVLNSDDREAFGLLGGVLMTRGRYQYSLHLFTALRRHWLPDPQCAFHIILLFTPCRFFWFEPSLSCSSDFSTWLQATPRCKCWFVTHMIWWNSTWFYW